MKSIVYRSAILSLLLVAAAAPQPTGDDAIRAARHSAEQVIRAKRQGLDLPVILAQRLKTDLPAWREAAGKNDPTGMWLLGLCNYHGIGGPQNEARGRDLLRRAAETKDAEAMAVWSIVLRNGNYHTAPDPDEANRWLGMALQARGKIAADMLPLLGADELLAEGKITEAVRVYERESKGGNLNATYKLANVYLQGFIIRPDFEESVRLLDRAAKNGHVPSMRRLAFIRASGSIGDRDVAEGRRLIEEAVATGDPESIRVASIGYDFGAFHENRVRQGNQALDLNKKLEAAIDPVSRFYVAQRDWSRTPMDDPKYESVLKPMLIDVAERGEPRAFMWLGVMAHGKPSQPAKDPKRARELLEWGVAAGDLYALFQQGSATRYGWYGRADEDKARELYFAAARRGMPRAMTSVALRFISGRGVKRNVEAGFYAYLAAAFSGDTEAMVAVSNCYRLGEGVKRDRRLAELWANNAVWWGEPAGYAALFRLDWDAKAKTPFTPKQIEYLEIGARMEDIECARMLGEEMIDGVLMKRDVARGLKILDAAVQSDMKGNAHVSLGHVYLMGRGVPADPQKALMYFRQAADRGNEEAWTSIGQVYSGDFGMPQNVSQMLQAYNKGIELGDSRAARSLARVYLHAKGVTRDTRRAVDLFEKAIELGAIDAAAELSVLLLSGEFGAEVDVARGMRAIEHAVSLGSDESAEAAAQYFRSKEDWAQERIWLERGHALGNVGCTNGLGVQYRFGRGVPQDFAKAVEYYRIAAEAGERVAMGNLAWCYEQGNGVEKNLPEAHRWALKAAEAGEVSAMIQVGRMYIDGIGTQKNPLEGLRWIAKAADAGDPKAKALIEAAKAKGVWR